MPVILRVSDADTLISYTARWVDGVRYRRAALTVAMTDSQVRAVLQMSNIAA